MRYLWSVVCNKAIIDETSRKLTLVDIPEVLVLSPDVQERIDPGKKVGVIVNLTLVAVFWCEKENEAIEVRIVLTGPNGQRGKPHNPIELAGSGPKDTSARLLATLDAMQFLGLGRYEVGLEMRQKGAKKWREVSSYPLIMSTAPSSAYAPPRTQSPPAIRR